MPLKEWNAYVYVLYDETQGKKKKPTQWSNPVNAHDQKQTQM